MLILLVTGSQAHIAQGGQGRTHGRVLSSLLCFGIQVVEISSLTEHLLTECDKKDGFGKCYRCSEAILKEELPRHIKMKDCNRECLLRPPPRALTPCVTSVLPGQGPAGGVSDKVSAGPSGDTSCFSAISSSFTEVTKSCFIEIISAAKSEKLANRCPLCHENFTPGEEVRGLTRGCDLTRG